MLKSEEDIFLFIKQYYPDKFKSIKSSFNLLKKTNQDNFFKLLENFRFQCRNLAVYIDDCPCLLLLEILFQKIEKREHKAFTARKIIKQARFFASSASSGSEGIARSRQLKELELKYSQWL